jgi:hypothetical protein
LQTARSPAFLGNAGDLRLTVHTSARSPAFLGNAGDLRLTVHTSFRIAINLVDLETRSFSLEKSPVFNLDGV